MNKKYFGWGVDGFGVRHYLCDKHKVKVAITADILQYNDVECYKCSDIKLWDYHRSCNKCGGDNRTVSSCYMDCKLAECETECNDCGFKDFWGYGHFASNLYEDCNACKKYYWKSGRKIICSP